MEIIKTPKEPKGHKGPKEHTRNLRSTRNAKEHTCVTAAHSSGSAWLKLFKVRSIAQASMSCLEGLLASHWSFVSSFQTLLPHLLRALVRFWLSLCQAASRVASILYQSPVRHHIWSLPYLSVDTMN